MMWELFAPYGGKQVFSHFPDIGTWSREPPAMSCVLPRMIQIDCIHIPFNLIPIHSYPDYLD